MIASGFPRHPPLDIPGATLVSRSPPKRPWSAPFICIDTPKNMQEIKQRWLAELIAAARQISREAQELDDLLL